MGFPKVTILNETSLVFYVFNNGLGLLECLIKKSPIGLWSHLTMCEPLEEALVVSKPILTCESDRHVC